MKSNSLFQINFILRRPKMANFAEIIKIVTIFIKSTLKKLNELEIIQSNLIF